MKPTYHDLRAWQEAMDFVETVYRVTADFPDHERFVLTAQIQRAAVSVPGNIAEGTGRNGNKAFLRCLYIARGSLCEIETQLLIAQRLEYISDTEKIMAKMDTLFGLLGGLIKSLHKKGEA